MRLVVPFLFAGLLLTPTDGWTQTAEIDKQVKEKLKQEKAKTEALDQLIAEALKNNPDIRVAEAKLREAAAQLYRVRLKVASDVATVDAEIEAAKAALDEGQKRFDRATMLHQKGAISPEEVDVAKLAVYKLKGDLTVWKLKSEMLSAPAKPAANQANPPSLDQLIAQASKDNPDIRVADAKMREVAAELDRVRLKVTSDVAILHAEMESVKAALADGQERYERATRLYENKGIAREEFDAVKLSLTKLKSELASVEAKLPYLLGRQAGARHPSVGAKLLLDKAVTDEEFIRRVMLDMKGRLPTPEETHNFMKMPKEERRAAWLEHLIIARSVAEYFSDPIGLEKSAPKPNSPMHQKLRKALDTEAKYPPQLNGKTLADIAGVIRDEERLGMNIVIRVKSKKTDKVNIQLEKPIPLGAFLQYLEDELDVVFILRDYGIVVVGADERMPPGAVRVVDFWKRGKAAEPKAESKDKK